MANEIPKNYVSGRILYLTRFQLDGNVFLTNGASDEIWGAGGNDADNYDVTMTEDGAGGHYVGNFDTSGNIVAGIYRVAVYLQAGGSPADSDFAIGEGEIYWDGSSEDNPSSISDQLNVLSAQGSRVLNKYPTRNQPDV